MSKGRPARAALSLFSFLRDGRAVALEEGEFFQIDDVLAVGGFALGQNGHAADDLAAGMLDQRFQRAQRFAGGDDVIDDEHALALHVLGVVTGHRQVLCLDGDDAEYMKGKRVVIVDDVISTGESLRALEALVEHAGGQIVGRMAILAEGEAADREDIIYLEKLPLFQSDGTPIA